MKKNEKMTTAQFAALHGVNKRTLHYYDAIGLFSPKERGENQYRYYDSSQTLSFEYLRMLKELDMGIDEIKSFLSHPSPEAFQQFAHTKISEIEEQIQKLRQTQALLSYKQKQLTLCGAVPASKIHIVRQPEENLLLAPFSFADYDLPQLFFHIKERWGMEQCRAGVGSYLSVDKLLKSTFYEYDGLFVPLLDKKRAGECFRKPRARYLCCYLKGAWTQLPDVYKNMVAYAKEHGLKLAGYAYEMGMNEFLVRKEEDYITQISIQIAD